MPPWGDIWRRASFARTTESHAGYDPRGFHPEAFRDQELPTQAHSSVRGAFLSSPGVVTAVCSAKSRRDDLIIAQYGSAHTSCTQFRTKVQRRTSAGYNGPGRPV